MVSLYPRGTQLWTEAERILNFSAHSSFWVSPFRTKHLPHQVCIGFLFSVSFSHNNFVAQSCDLSAFNDLNCSSKISVYSLMLQFTAWLGAKGTKIDRFAIIKASMGTSNFRAWAHQKIAEFSKRWENCTLEFGCLIKGKKMNSCSCVSFHNKHEILKRILKNILIETMKNVSLPGS